MYPLTPCTQEAVIAGLQHDLDNLKGWQKSQNGAIHRVEKKLDNLIMWGLGFMAANFIGLLFLMLKGGI